MRAEQALALSAEVTRRVNGRKARPTGKINYFFSTAKSCFFPEVWLATSFSYWPGSHRVYSLYHKTHFFCQSTLNCYRYFFPWALLSKRAVSKIDDFPVFAVFFGLSLCMMLTALLLLYDGTLSSIVTTLMTNNLPE